MSWKHPFLEAELHNEFPSQSIFTGQLLTSTMNLNMYTEYFSHDWCVKIANYILPGEHETSQTSRTLIEVKQIFQHK